MPDFVEFPKMLYKAEATKQEAHGFLSQNDRIGYITVQSPAEEGVEKKNGWVNNASQAEKQLGKIDRNRRVRSFLIRNWKTWLTTFLTIIGLYIAYLTYLGSK